MINLQRHATELITALCAIAPQLLKSTHTAFVARTSRFDAFANPDLFLRQQLVKAGVF